MKWALVVLLLLPGCATDPTSAIKTTIAVQAQADSMADGFASVVKGATGWSQEQKDKVLADIEKAKKTFALLQSVRRYLETVGEVQWSEVVDALRKEAGL